MYCCDDIGKIENYDKAIADATQFWEIHHRLESEHGMNIEELMDKDMYYKRPASELIFLTHKEHMRIHAKTKTGPFKEVVIDKWRKTKKEKRDMRLHGRYFVWWNNGIENVSSKIRPGPDFVKGKLKKKAC